MEGAGAGVDVGVGAMIDGVVVGGSVQIWHGV